jgi:hypothetical protein
MRNIASLLFFMPKSIPPQYPCGFLRKKDKIDVQNGYKK